MIALIYQQTYDRCVCAMEITEEDVLRGFAKRTCEDCQGTGIYLLPDDDTEPCVACKGTGKRWVSL